MTLKSLIENQRLRIDSHTRGENILSNLRGVHIHKSFYEGRRRGKSVRISIKGESIEFGKDFDDEDRRSIVNEINKVLEKDRQKLIEFAKYIADGLYRWSQKSIKIEESQKYASGIAERFGLNTKANKQLIKIVGEQLVQHISTHRDEDGKIYTINQKREGVIMRPGSRL